MTPEQLDTMTAPERFTFAAKMLADQVRSIQDAVGRSSPADIQAALATVARKIDDLPGLFVEPTE